MGYKCLIPAGGFGVRLGELTKEKPKALLPLGKKTVLDHIYEKLCELDDLEEICVVTNDKFLEQFEEWSNTISKQKPLTIISDGGTNKDNAVGANKGTWIGVEKMGWQNEDVLIMGSDNFIPTTLKDISDNFNSGEDSLVTVCDYRDKNKVRRLVVPEMDEDGNVIKIIEKPENPSSTLGCPLVYFVKSKDIKYLEELAGIGQNNLGHLLELINKNSKLKGHLLSNFIIDIGLYPDYSFVKDLF